MEDFLPIEQAARTPAFIYNLGEVKKRVTFLSQIKNKSNCKILYSVKPLPLFRVLEEMESLDGFSVSSFFEAKLVQKACKDGKEIHFISPRNQKRAMGRHLNCCQLFNV